MRYQLSDQEVFISKLAETDINTPYELAAEMVGIRLNSQMPPIPEPTLMTDDMIGDGTERSLVLRGGWWKPNEVTIAGQINTETAARLGGRCLGGTRTSTAVTVGQSYNVITKTQTKAQGRIPKLTTFGTLLGGYDFIYPSMGVNSFEISFEGEGNVNFSAALINTGYWLHNADLDIPIVAPAAPTHHLMHPAATRVTFSDGSTIDFAAEGELISGSCNFSQNMVVRQLPGDPFLDPDDRKSGAFARDIHRGKRDMTPQIKVALDDDLQAFVLMQDRTSITNLTYLFRSDEKITTTDEYFEFEWVYPLAQIQTVSADTDGDDAAITMTFYPKRDPVTLGYINQRVLTGDTNLQ